MKVKVIKNANKAIAELEKLNKRMEGQANVAVGLPKGTNDYPDGTDTIMVAAIHEFGSAINNVPQRSFLRTTVNDNTNQYKSLFFKLSKQIVQGRLTQGKALNIVGLRVQSDVQQRITDIQEPPLKHRQGNPLIDTGHLRQSITFEVTE